jgi:hypothetical protein
MKEPYLKYREWSKMSRNCSKLLKCGFW